MSVGTRSVGVTASTATREEDVGWSRARSSYGTLLGAARFGTDTQVVLQRLVSTLKHGVLSVNCVSVKTDPVRDGR